MGSEVSQESIAYTANSAKPIGMDLRHYVFDESQVLVCNVRQYVVRQEGVIQLQVDREASLRPRTIFWVQSTYAVARAISHKKINWRISKFSNLRKGSGLLQIIRLYKTSPP